MYLSAISIGYAVPSVDFEASVHSAFRAAINLRPSGGSELLTLVTSSEADLPQGIRVEAPKDFSFEIPHTGGPATCRDGSLRLNSLTIELRGAQRWKCDLPALMADVSDPVASTAWSLVWNALNEQQNLSGSDLVAEELFQSGKSARTSVSHKAGAAMRDLVNAARQYKLIDPYAVNSLIGLGSGLTPSGDDLLVGYLAGLWSTVQNKSERAQFVSDLGKTIVCLSRRTNDISRTYLYHAARGQVSSRLANLAKAICHGENPGRLLETAESAVQVGHTSGLDAVTGLLIGLATWISSGISCF
jgi:hypothetical protein